MITLSIFEQFAISTALLFLQLLASKITNKTELAALDAAITFLQKLLAGQVSAT